MELFKLGFLSVRLLDVADILAVAFVIYRAYKAFQRTVVFQLLLAILALFVLWQVAEYLDLLLLRALLNQVVQIGAIVLVVVFAPEIRRYLIHISQTTTIWTLRRQLGGGFNPTEQQYRELIDACDTLAATRTGAIIVLEGENDIRHIEETGDVINAEMSKRLLISIFNRTSPLHDGAVLIRGSQILAARCVLPISDDPDIPAELGMRHRAALGITEVSDAAAIVVSEETGKIAVAQGGRLKRNLSNDELYAFLSNQ